jgi:hypothetical protein
MPPPPPYSEHYAQPVLSHNSPPYTSQHNTAPPYTPRALNTNTESQSHNVEPPAEDAVSQGHDVEVQGYDAEGQGHNVRGHDVRGRDVGGQNQDAEDVEGPKIEDHDTVGQGCDAGSEREPMLRTTPKEQDAR